MSLRNALDQRRLRDENRSLKKAVEVRHQMIGESGALKHVMAAVARAAPTNATVLIYGESGVGKELVARTIHRNSLRSRERFVQVNCAAIPEELIESELFGHEKGRSPAPPKSRSASSSRPICRTCRSAFRWRR